MTEDEFRKKAKEMGFSEGFIEKTIYEHNHEKFALSYEFALECESSMGAVRSYNVDEDGSWRDEEV